MKKLSLKQKIKLWISGHVYVGHDTRPRWIGSLPFYAFKCPVHGLVRDYPHGHEDRLDCPHCGYSIGIVAKELYK